MLITNARVLTFDASDRVLDSSSVEIRADGSFGAIGKRHAGEHEETLDAKGRLLMPALINCHTHLYSTMARGMTIPGRAPQGFRDILRKLWWRLDCALNEDDVYYSALVGLIESAKSGVGTLIDHHSSPNACGGSLDRIEQAFREVGLRGALCYETSDRNGARKAAGGLQENIRFIERVRRAPGDGMIGANFGLHASFTLGDRTLRRAIEANESLGAGFHIHVAEDACDRGAVERLHQFGVLGERTVAAHCLHVSLSDMTTLAHRRVNVILNPQSNCNNGVGSANLLEMVRRGVSLGLGSDGYSPRMWEELQTVLHLQKLRRLESAGAWGALLNNREIVRKLWGMDVGRIQTRARADLILVDYFPPTPLRRDNIFGHLLFGISKAPIDSVMVNGRFIVQDRRCVTVDERAIFEKAAVRARSLWRRFETACQL